jgi:hypothetical protein
LRYRFPLQTHSPASARRAKRAKTASIAPKKEAPVELRSGWKKVVFAIDPSACVFIKRKNSIDFSRYGCPDVDVEGFFWVKTDLRFRELECFIQIAQQACEETALRQKEILEAEIHWIIKENRSANPKA